MVLAESLTLPRERGSRSDSPLGLLVFRVLNTSRHGQLVRLRSAKCTIGSSPDCTLRLDAFGVRPLHCLVVRGPRTTLVRRWAPDTLLNGQSFSDAELRAGDRLSLGPIDLEVVQTTDTTPVTQASSPVDFQKTSEPSYLSRRMELANRQGRQRLHRTLAALRDARREIARLQAAASPLGTAADPPSRRNPDTVERATLEAALAEQRAELDARREEILAEQETWNRQQERFEQARQESEADQRRRTSELDTRQNELDRQRQALQEQTHQHEMRQSEWNAERDAFEKRQSEWNAEREAFEKRQAEWNAQQEAVEKRKSEWNTDREALEERLRQSQAELDQARAKLDQSRAELDQARRQANQIDEQCQKREEAWERACRDWDEEKRQAEADLEQSRRRWEDEKRQAEADLERRRQEWEEEKQRSESRAEPPAAEPSRTDRGSPVEVSEVLSRFGRVPLATEDDATDQAADNRPGPAPSPRGPASEVAASKHHAGADDGDESIERYMARLMERVRTAATEPTEPVTGSDEPERRDGESRGLAGRAAPATSEPAPPQGPVDLTPRRAAPERSDHLLAMRELASASAQTAIDQHAQKMLQRAIREKLLITIGAAACGAGLIAGWSLLGLGNLTYYAGLVCILLAVVWGIQYAVLTGRLIVRRNRPAPWRGEQIPEASGAEVPPGDDEPTAASEDVAGWPR